MQQPIVDTAFGKVLGTQSEGVAAFLGIRYAQAERFAPPRPPQPWSGVQNALSFGAIAPQVSPDPALRRAGIILEELGPPPATATAPQESEDCFFLNVWTSDPSRSARKPVMVWLHPGFFMVGSGATGTGANLARRGDVVVVSLNHRLNIFGYTHLDDVGGPDFRHSGNLGQLDIVAALEWVRANIEAFGGDPSRVMVFGASGGGMKTAWLMASPRGRGLLHRAGAQSGPTMRFMSRETANEVSEALLSELGLKRSECDALRTLPAERLLLAFHRLRARFRAQRFTHLAAFAPVLDPELLPRQPDAADASSIPLLIGWNREDMAFFFGRDVGVNEHNLESRIAAFAGALAREVIDIYRRYDPAATALQVFLRAFSDYSIGVPALLQAERHANAGRAPAFVYRFDWPSPTLEGKLGALHSLESHLVFDNVDMGKLLTGGAPEAHALAKRMSAAWAAFATNGDPNMDTLPSWQRFSTPKRAVMLLNSSSQLVNDPVSEVRHLFAALPEYQ